jgi:hypothetical protein
VVSCRFPGNKFLYNSTDASEPMMHETIERHRHPTRADNQHLFLIEKDREGTLSEKKGKNFRKIK